MKKVFLEMDKLNNMNSGLGQFCFHFGNTLSQQTTLRFEPYFFLPAKMKNIFGSKFNYISSNKFHKFFPVKGKFDVWHCLHQESSYLPSKKSAKIILTIHDLNFLEVKKSRWKQKLRLKKLQRLINKADALTVISKYTEKAVRENLTIPNIPLKVIYNGNALKTFSSVSKPDFVPEGKFFFSIGIIAPKKNFILLIPLLKHFKDFQLIIAGNKDHKHVQEIQAVAIKEGVEDRLIMPGNVTEEEKYWLYQNCTAFLFPSMAEGFGLPVIEAMSLGKPVFLSRFTSLPEIGGEEAFYFNSFESQFMHKTIKDGLKEYDTDKEKSQRIIDWSRQFSWSKAVDAYQELYYKI